MRFAGDLALIGVAGTGAALAADQLVHDDMDRLAQDSKDLRAQAAGQPQELLMAYEEVFAGEGVSMMDRVVAAGVLNGEISPVDGPIQADSPAGKKTIELALQIRQARPDLGVALASLAAKDLDLIARQSEKGITTADVISAGEMGSGVSPVPAILAGTGVGGGVAALAALTRKRGGGGDPFQARRRGQ
jgi:hypothetical protein